MADYESTSEAQRLLDIIDARIAAAIGSTVERTWGIVAAVHDDLKNADVYLYGQSVASEAFRYVNGVHPAVGQRVRVSIDRNAQDRWIDEVITATACDALSLDPSGVIRLGSGTDAPDANLYRSAANTLKTDDSLVVSGNLGAASVSTNDGTVSIGAMGSWAGKNAIVPDFEKGSLGTWIPAGGTTSSIYVRSWVGGGMEATPYHGVYRAGLQKSPTDPYCFIYTGFGWPVHEGDVLTIGAFLSFSGGAWPSAGIGYSFVNVAGAEIAAGTVWTGAVGYAQFYSGTVTVPANAVSVRPRVFDYTDYVAPNIPTLYVTGPFLTRA